jgi:hypothetical protein
MLFVLSSFQVAFKSFRSKRKLLIHDILLAFSILISVLVPTRFLRIFT